MRRVSHGHGKACEAGFVPVCTDFGCDENSCPAVFDAGHGQALIQGPERAEPGTLAETKPSPGEVVSVIAWELLEAAVDRHRQERGRG